MSEPVIAPPEAPPPAADLDVEASPPAAPEVAPAEAPQAPAAPAAPVVREHTVEDWALIKGTAPNWFAVARVREAWAIGSVITEKAYDDALHRAQHEVCR